MRINRYEVLNDAKVKINNENRHEALNDLETQCYSNQNKTNKTNDHKNKPNMKKSNLCDVDNVETSLLNKTIETFVERDNDDNEEESHEELETINYMSNQVTNALACRLREAWIDIKTTLNVEVISKESNDLMWCKINSKWHGTM